MHSLLFLSNHSLTASNLFYTIANLFFTIFKLCFMIFNVFFTIINLFYFYLPNSKQQHHVFFAIKYLVALISTVLSTTFKNIYFYLNQSLLFLRILKFKNKILTMFLSKKDCIKQENGNLPPNADAHYSNPNFQKQAVKKSLTIYNEGKSEENEKIPLNSE